MKKVVLYARVSTKDQDCERQISELRTIERLAREVAAVEKTDYFQSTEKIEQILSNK